MKIKDIEDKIPNITNVAINAAFTVAEDKTYDVNDLVKKKQITIKK